MPKFNIASMTPEQVRALPRASVLAMLEYCKDLQAQWGGILQDIIDAPDEYPPSLTSKLICEASDLLHEQSDIAWTLAKYDHGAAWYNGHDGGIDTGINKSLRDLTEDDEEGFYELLEQIRSAQGWPLTLWAMDLEWVEATEAQDAAALLPEPPHRAAYFVRQDRAAARNRASLATKARKSTQPHRPQRPSRHHRRRAALRDDE